MKIGHDVHWVQKIYLIMLRSSNWLGHSPFTGELMGSSPIRSTKQHTSQSVKPHLAVSVCWVRNKVAAMFPHR